MVTPLLILVALGAMARTVRGGVLDPICDAIKEVGNCQQIVSYPTVATKMCEGDFFKVPCLVSLPKGFAGLTSCIASSTTTAKPRQSTSIHAESVRRLK